MTLFDKFALALSLMLAVWLFPNGADAHRLRPAIITVTFSLDATYRIEIRTNMEAVLARIGPQHADTRDSPSAVTYDALRSLAADELSRQIAAFGREYLSGVVVEFDGVRVSPQISSISVPPVGDIARTRLTTVTLIGEIPVHTQTFVWSYAARYGNNVLKLRNAGDPEFSSYWLKDGATSAPFRLGEQIVPKSTGEVAVAYTSLGFTHILPMGLDHILFVLGIFLLSVRLRPIL